MANIPGRASGPFPSFMQQQSQQPGYATPGMQGMGAPGSQAYSSYSQPSSPHVDGKEFFRQARSVDKATIQKRDMCVVVCTQHAKKGPHAMLHGGALGIIHCLYFCRCAGPACHMNSSVSFCTTSRSSTQGGSHGRKHCDVHATSLEQRIRICTVSLRAARSMS